MKLFRLGYITTVGFLLVLAAVTLTLGFYPAPKGPKAPDPPTYNSMSSYNFSSPNPNQYDQQLRQQQQEEQKYQDAQKKYQDSQKNFVQDQIVPYARNIFVGMIIVMALFELIGVLLARTVSELVGAAFAFSGVWAVVFGPLGALIWFANSLVSSFSHSAEDSFTIEPLLQAVGITCLICVILLAVVGTIFYSNRHDRATV